MIQYPNIDPIIFQINLPLSKIGLADRFLALRWYGVLYGTGFIIALAIWRYYIRKGKFRISIELADKFLLWSIAGVIIGARIGYIIFYNPDKYLNNPLSMFMIWEGGLSFHGSLIGLIVTTYIFSKKFHIPFFHLGDFVALSGPLGLGLGRIGNFINGELYGRVTDVPWGMVFPRSGDLPRHPSQLYESFFEGFLLFFILIIIEKRKKNNGVVMASFILFYGIFRFFIEFFRQPDKQFQDPNDPMGFVVGFFSMGQVLCIGMVIGSILLIQYLRKTSIQKKR